MTGILPAGDIAIKDIERLIEINAERSMNLELRPGSEFKDLDQRFANKLSVIVSSIANTNGGTLIYGVDTKRKRAAAFSYISVNENTKFWIENILSHQIKRNIDGLEVKVASFENNPEKSIIIIEIPESKQAPHMAFDNKFYRRYNLKEMPMEENEVRMLYNRTNVSDIEFFGVINTNAVPVMSGGKFDIVSFFPKFLIRNVSSRIEHDYKVEISIPSALCDENFTALHSCFSRFDDIYNVYSIPNKSPLFQEELATIVEVKLQVKKETYDTFNDSDIVIKLFYSNGLKTHRFKLKETFRYKHKTIELTDFSDKLTENVIDI